MAKDTENLGLGIVASKTRHRASSTPLKASPLLRHTGDIFWQTLGNFGSTIGFRHVFIAILTLSLCLAAIFGLMMRQSPPESLPTIEEKTVLEGTVMGMRAPVTFTQQRFSINWTDNMPVLMAHLDMQNTGNSTLNSLVIAIDLFDSQGQLLRRISHNYDITMTAHSSATLTVPIRGVSLAVASIKASVLNPNSIVASNQR